MNFGLNITGGFNNLASSGTFRLPNLDLVEQINSKGGKSQLPVGSVQFAKEGGNFGSNSNIYIRDKNLGGVDNISVTGGGSGYSVALAVPTTTTSGGTGLTVDINSVDGSGAILDATVNTRGLGYEQFDTFKILQGTNDSADGAVGVTDLPFNRLVIDSSSALNGEPISGLVMVPPSTEPNASWIARDGTIGYFKRFVSNFGYAQNDVITLDTPLGGTAAQITVNGPPGVNGQVGNGNTTLTNPGTNYVVGDILNQVSTTGVGQFFTCQVLTITGGGSVGPIGSYTVASQLRKDFQGYTEGTGWQSFTSQGGIASAAGNQYEIQYNNNNQLGANSNLKFDPTTNIFEVGTVSNVESKLTGPTTVQSAVGGNILECIAATGNNAGISLNTINTSNSIALATGLGGITTQSNAGPTSIRSQTGAIDLTRSFGGTTTQVAIGATGDLTLSTTGTNNEIRLLTSAVSSEIILQTNAAGCDIQLDANGTTSDIDLTATQNINATSESLEVSNNASNGSTIQMQGGIVGSVLNLEDTVGGDNIILTGTNGTLQLGAAGSTGDLQIRNLPLGVSDIVAQINVDGSNAGRLALSDSTPTETILLTGVDGIAAATEIAAGGKLIAQSYIRLTQPASGDCRIGTQGAASTNLRMTSLQDINTGTGYLAFEQRASTLTTDLIPTDTAWSTSGNRSKSAGVFCPRSK